MIRRRRRETKPPPIKFEDVFSIHARCPVAGGPDEQLFAFCLVIHTDYLIVASSTPDARPVDGEGGTWLGVSECVTFHTLHMPSGVFVDKMPLVADSVHLTHQGAVSVFEDVVAIVSPGQNSIYVLRVTRDGKFESLRSLGRYCFEDDEEEVEGVEEAARLWAVRARSEASTHEGRGIDIVEGEGGGEVRAQNAMLPPPPLPALPLPPVAETPGLLIEGLKQRLLAYMFLEASVTSKRRKKSVYSYHQEDDEDNEEEEDVASHQGQQQQKQKQQQQFFYFFNVYLELEMQGVLLLEPQHILVSWSPPLSLRGPLLPLYARGLHMIYNMETTKVECLFEGGSVEFAEWCVGNGVVALGGTPSNDWERYVLPGVWGHYLRARGVQDPVVRASAHPPGYQQQQSSPYVDPEVYQFDERAITRDLVPRPMLHRPAKFVARVWPERLRFRFLPEDVGEGGGGGEGGGTDPSHQQQHNHMHHKEVMFVFHPTAPFVMAAVESAETGIAEEMSFYVYAG